MLIVYCLLFIVPSANADYVLPYPSFMPGNKMSAISRIVDALKEYWYFGTIAKVQYHLGLADKYLVEAKTLFEDRQYLLAADALTRSSDQFERIPQFLKYTRQKNIVREASDAHIRVLEELAIKLPDEFEWRPEKAGAALLPIGTLIREAKSLRRAVKEIITDY